MSFTSMLLIAVCCLCVYLFFLSLSRKREHSLLLDVMLVLYKREWFTQEAVPYVRRTLNKCGMRVDQMN